MFVKVCGITTPGQLDHAIELGYTAAGVVLHPASTRCCSERRATELALHARGRIAMVAVGLTFDEVACVADEFDFVQVYEFRNRERVICAGDSELIARDASLFMYDSSRGSGRPGRFPAWLHDIRWKLIISGGLTPRSVAGVVRKFQPFGVDVSSGVESSPGEKDYELMKQFISEVTNAIR
jgi:phosphoribosylanthranilate isomerase